MTSTPAQHLAPSVVGLVAELEFMRTKVQRLRRRWTEVQSQHINQVQEQGRAVELETKVHTKVLNHGGGPYFLLGPSPGSFTFKTLFLQHYAKWTLEVKLGR